MTITNEPLALNSPVKFTVTGFPEETAVRASVERFYGLKTEADRNFLIFNSFKEQIFSGSANEEGKIEKLEAKPRTGKSPFPEVKPQ